MLTGFFKNIVLMALMLQLSFGVPLAAYAQSDQIEQPPAPPALVYNSVMRHIQNNQGADLLRDFIAQEKERLPQMGASESAGRAYIARLEKQLRIVENNPSFLEKLSTGAKNLLGLQKDVPEDQADLIEPQKPSALEFVKKPVVVQPFEISDDARDAAPQPSLFKRLFGALDVHALDDPLMPVLEDTVSNDKEITITPEIVQKAQELRANPVEIVNFVRDSITFEPYYGSKKGAHGCLLERLCNDVDAASLTIALLRSAGIPARYTRGAAVVETDMLKNLLGVDRVETAFAAFAFADFPIFTLQEDGIEGEIEDVDVEHLQALVLHWTSVEAFYDYDHRGANVDNATVLKGIADTQTLRDILRRSTKKQWIPIDVIFKDYQRIENPILVEDTNFDTDAFWYDYFEYQGDSTPLQKYQDDVNALAQGATVAQSLSYRQGAHTHWSMLPPSLPYLFGAGQSPDRQIVLERFSSLPDHLMVNVRITLMDEDDNLIFDTTLSAHEANNVELSIGYEGATDQDKQIIDNHGGLHATPAELVRVVPYLIAPSKNIYGLPNNAVPEVGIGDRLILGFEYAVGGNVMDYSDEKFSIAGNHEGIFISFSGLSGIDAYDDQQDTARASKIMSAGNAAIAREYIKELLAAQKFIGQSLDYTINTRVVRAVVTQNRILSEIDGRPSTFTFKGLSIDSSAYIADYSNRGDFRNHQLDARLLYGLEVSHLEARLFEDLAGLNALATVQGLQFAHANPNDYTVHIINSDNQGDIDGLNVSNNTKDNMRADVQSGNTIITPNQAVRMGSWQGFFYVSRDPEGTGRYAIGEQVAQNGGFTQDVPELEVEVVENEEVGFYVIRSLFKYFVYQDLAKVGGKSCVTSLGQQDQIQAIMDQDLNRTQVLLHGKPCLSDTVNYGGHDHTYILTTNGLKVTGPGYNYWTMLDPFVYEAFDNYVEDKKNLPEDNPNYLESGESVDLRFSTVLGTFINQVCIDDSFFFEGCPFGAKANLYYVPYHQGDEFGRVYQAREQYLDKLAEDSNGVIVKVGLPQSDIQRAAASATVVDDDRWYQDFQNGQIYSFKKRVIAFRQTYYIYGGLHQAYNDSFGGSGGQLGFPQSDPEVNNAGLRVLQRFEDGDQLAWNTSNNTVALEEYFKYQCELYDHINDPFRLQLISLHGIYDTGIQTLDDGLSLAGGIIEGILSPVDTYHAVEDIYEEVSKISFDQWADVLRGMGSAAYDALLEEYDRASCSARAQYLGGRIAGEVLLIWLPVSKLKAATKVSVATRIIDKSADLANISKKLSFVSKHNVFGKTFRLVDADDVAEWNRIKNVPANQKDAASKDFWQSLLDGDSEQEVVAAVLDPNLGNRRVDVLFEDEVTGVRHAFELKNYGSRKVSLSDIGCTGLGNPGAVISADCQILKDVWLMNNDPAFKPTWVFADKGPGSGLRDALRDHGIEVIELTQ